MGDTKDFPGENGTVRWDARLCIHIGECGRSEGELFVGGREPWCQPDVAGIDLVQDVVERCPTGSLTLRKKDGSVIETVPAENVVVVSNHGPLYVRGNLAIDGAADDMEGTKHRAALCRCGQSKNKPFCDNTHEKTGFRDHGAIGEKGEGAKGKGGTLEIKKAKNGPLLLSGHVRLVAASGRVAWEGEKCALCRCGESKNKPFCDGSHKAAGFEAD